jgi:hypothetical protein
MKFLTIVKPRPIPGMTSAIAQATLERVKANLKSGIKRWWVRLHEPRLQRYPIPFRHLKSARHQTSLADSNRYCYLRDITPAARKALNRFFLFCDLNFTTRRSASSLGTAAGGPAR